jgi:hypothetical protein
MCCRKGEGLRLHSSPFPLDGHGVSSRSPGAVKGARRLRVHRSEAQTLYGENERLRLQAGERGSAGCLAPVTVSEHRGFRAAHEK